MRGDRHVRLDELLIGAEGLALLRNLYDGSDEDAGARLSEVRAILNGPIPSPSPSPGPGPGPGPGAGDGDGDGVSHGDAGHARDPGELIAESDPRAGYGIWAATYDDPGNPIVALEQPAVWALIDRLPPRRTLDAACGTGRHAARLVTLGHQVDGIDLTPEMLARARVNVPDASFRVADLRSIPSADGAYDLVVCGLALAHLAELGDAVAELSRVLAPGGRLIVSVLHPFLAALGWQAPFTGADGRRGFVREHPHAHADYVVALQAAGLRLEQLVEPRLSEEQTRAKRRASGEIPEATIQAYAGLPGVLVLEAAKS